MLYRITVGPISHGLGIRSSLPGDAGIVVPKSNMVMPVPTSTEIIAAMFSPSSEGDAPSESSRADTHDRPDLCHPFYHTQLLQAVEQLQRNFVK
jgi:hypothetical protein